MKINETVRSSDGTCLNYNIWQIENPKYLMCISHGLGEHIDRYDPFASYFNDQSICVAAMDYRGHGKSEGKRGFASSFELLLDDYHTLIEKASKQVNDVPVILFGHSMGGCVLANYLIDSKYEVQSTSKIHGAIISSPWLELAKKVSNLELRLSSIISKFFPSLTISNGLKVEDISGDPVEVEKYREDPLVHDRISIRLFHDVYSYGQNALMKAGSNNLPCYVYHGGADKITSQPASERYCSDLPKGKYRIWEGTKHEPHNDTKRTEVLTSIKDWIQLLS